MSPFDLKFENDYIKNLFYTLTEEAAETGIFIIDPKINIILASKEAEKLAGITNLSYLNNNFYNIVPLFDADGKKLAPSSLPIEKVLKGHKQTSPFFCCGKDQEKKLEPWVLKVYPIGNESGYGAIIKLRKAKRELTVEEMKNVFISFAAHQLKTPSSIVKGYLELLLKNKNLDEKTQAYLRSAFDANEQLIGRSHKLLNLTKIEGGLMEPSLKSIDLVSSIKKWIKRYEALASYSNIKIDLNDVPKTEVKIITDPDIAGELFNILLENALRFSPVNSQINLKITQERQSINLSIRDFGPGLKEGQYEDSQGIGLVTGSNNHGLGLRLAYKLAHLLNLNILVKNAPIGPGVNASITFPAE